MRSTSTRRIRPVRDEYGRNAAGLRLLLARRLVAAGVRFVTPTYGSWDLHDGIAAGCGTRCPPSTRRWPR